MEIICCKDCIHYEWGKCQWLADIMDGYYQGAEEREPNDFCSKAERK